MREKRHHLLFCLLVLLLRSFPKRPYSCSRRAWLWCGVAAFGLAVAGQRAVAEEVASLASLIAWAQGLEGAVGRFEQVQEQRGGQTLRLTGRFVYRQPLLFRWEVEQPFVQVTVSDGRRLITWDPELRQVTRAPLASEALANGPLGFLLAPHRLAETYTLTAVERNGATTRWVLQSQSRDAPLVAQLEVVLVGERLEALSVTDPLGQRSTIRFTTFERRTPPASAFHLDPPPEAVIVDLPEGKGL